MVTRLIPAALVYITRKRKNVAYAAIAYAFCALVTVCCSVHFLVIRGGEYTAHGFLKIITAATPTVLVWYPLMQKLLALKSAKQVGTAKLLEQPFQKREARKDFEQRKLNVKTARVRVEQILTAGYPATVLDHVLNHPSTAIRPSTVTIHQPMRSELIEGERRFVRLDENQRHAWQVGETIHALRVYKREQVPVWFSAEINKSASESGSLVNINARHADVKILVQLGGTSLVNVLSAQIVLVLIDLLTNSIEAIASGNCHGGESKIVIVSI